VSCLYKSAASKSATCNSSGDLSDSDSDAVNIVDSSPAKGCYFSLTELFLPYTAFLKTSRYMFGKKYACILKKNLTYF